MHTYTGLYFALLDNIPVHYWRSLFELEEVTFLCYCQRGKFCHRDLIAYYILFQYYHKKDINHPINIALNELKKKPIWINGDRTYQNINKKIFNVLECSSVGDTRFSAFFAMLTFKGTTQSIEHIYQLSKRFGEFVPSRWQEGKGKHPSHFNFMGKDFPIEALSSFYHWLWLKYLDQHPELVKFAAMFETFSDKFRGKSINCQALSIEIYVKKGRACMVEVIQPYFDQFEELIK